MVKIPFVPAVPTPTRFIPLGRIEIDRDVQEVVCPNDILGGILRHGAGRWGYVSSDMAMKNEAALKSGRPLVSIHRSRTGKVFSIITEADRTITYVMIGE